MSFPPQQIKTEMHYKAMLKLPQKAPPHPPAAITGSAAATLNDHKVSLCQAWTQLWVLSVNNQTFILFSRAGQDFQEDIHTPGSMW